MQDRIAEVLPKDDLTLWYVAGGAVALVVLVLVLRSLFKKKPPPRRDPEAGLREDLSEYPPPPAAEGDAKLTFNGRPVRVRLIVVAPSGGGNAGFTADEVPSLLEQVLPGIRAVMRTDKPRVRVWPPQLSARGFAPKFYRLVRKPEEDGEESNWVLSAGPVKAGRRTLLLGLAMLSDRPTAAGQIDLGTEDNPNVLRVRQEG